MKVAQWVGLKVPQMVGVWAHNLVGLSAAVKGVTRAARKDSRWVLSSADRRALSRAVRLAVRMVSTTSESMAGWLGVKRAARKALPMVA